MGVAKYEYVMDYIKDKDVYKAVVFARNMINDGTSPSIAIRRSSYYYGVDMKDVAKYIGQRGGRISAERRRKK